MNDSIYINLPEGLRRFVDRQAAQGGFREPGDYVRAVLAHERERLAREQVDRILLNALEAPSGPVTDADFERVRQTFRDRASGWNHA